MNLLKRLLEQLVQCVTPSPPGGAVITPGLEARRLVLDELRNVLARQSEAGDALDGKLKELLGTASLVITLATALQVAAASEESVWVLRALVASLVLFVAMVMVILRGIGPVSYSWPVPTGQGVADCDTSAAADLGWNEIESRLLDKSEVEALELLISNHLVCINENHRPLKSKSLHVKIALVLLLSIVVVLVASGIAILFGL